LILHLSHWWWLPHVSFLALWLCGHMPYNQNSTFVNLTLLLKVATLEDRQTHSLTHSLTEQLIIWCRTVIKNWWCSFLLTSHLQPYLKLRMCGAIPLLSHIFSWCSDWVQGQLYLLYIYTCCLQVDAFQRDFTPNFMYEFKN
jgi:hypothetical protein